MLSQTTHKPCRQHGLWTISDALPPLADLVKETTRVSLLFSGRGAIGRWNSKSQCGGISTKKKIAHKFTRHR